MFKLTWNQLRFSIVTFSAAMAALYLSMSIDLRQPYWGMMTVYIVSNPLTAAVRSKALHRLIGTFVGACVAVLLVPRLINAPVLLSLSLALWVGFCLAVSLLDRSPRSYMLMLAGYTAAIIGFSSVSQPGDIFNLAVARTEEISIGILCATLAHSLFFPSPVGHALRDRISAWLSEADQWSLDMLRSDDLNVSSQGRIRLASAASEIHIMATHLPFDTSHLRETTAIVRALHDRILRMIPILSSISDRLLSLRAEQPALDSELVGTMQQLEDWIKAGAPAAGAESLLATLNRLSNEGPRNSWYDLNKIALASRFQDLITAQAESRALLTHLYDLEAPLSPALQKMIANASQRPMHSDPELAAISGLAATGAMLIACFAWINLGWIEGASSALITGILCCLFASMDDPVPAIKAFGISTAVSLVMAGSYNFLIFPAIHSFPMLVMVLMFPLIAIGILMPLPKFAMPALLTIMNFCNCMAIQERFDVDFAHFLNINLSQFFGVLIAIYMTRTLRSLSADASVRRLLKRTWNSLSQVALGLRGETPEDLTARMVDRIGLIAPRLALSENAAISEVDVLRELRIEMDIITLHQLAPDLEQSIQTKLTDLLNLVSTYYRGRMASRSADTTELLSTVDQTLHQLIESVSVQRTQAVASLVGLRRNLFPLATYLPYQTSGALS